MRAKILLVAQDEPHREALRLAQNVLSEVALAFSHSFAMREFVTGEHGDARDVAKIAQQHDAAMLAGGVSFLQEIGLMLGCHAGYLTYQKHADIQHLTRLKAGPLADLDLIWPLADSASAIGKTAVSACSLAYRNTADVLYVAPEDGADYSGALNKAAMYAALPSAPRSMPLDSFLISALRRIMPAQLVMAAPKDAALAAGLLHYLNGTELLTYTMLLSDNGQFYGVTRAKQEEAPLFSVLYATQAMLKSALNMDREGDCLRSAVDNVFASCWCTSASEEEEQDISTEEIMERISQQIRLAGELLDHFGK